MIHEHGTYIGPLTMLKGRTALLMRSGENSIHIKAQFDDLNGLPYCLTHGWQPFKKDDFSIDRDMSKVFEVIRKRDQFRATVIALDQVCRHGGTIPAKPVWTEADEDAAVGHWPSPRIRENY